MFILYNDRWTKFHQTDGYAKADVCTEKKQKQSYNHMRKIWSVTLLGQTHSCFTSLCWTLRREPLVILLRPTLRRRRFRCLGTSTCRGPFKQKGRSVIHHRQWRSPPCHHWRSPPWWGSLQRFGGKDSSTQAGVRSGGREKSRGPSGGVKTLDHVIPLKCPHLPLNMLLSLCPSAGRRSSRPGCPSSCSAESSARSS